MNAVVKSSRKIPRVCISSCKHLLTSSRNFGIGDSLMGIATKKVEQSREKDFAVVISSMIDSPKWTLRPWRVTIEAQLNSWGMYVPGVSSSSEMVEMKKFKEILDVMTVQEIDNPDSLTGTHKARICAASSKTPEDMSRLIFVWKQSLIVHTWLHEMKRNGEALPSSREELMAMQTNDPRLRAIGAKIMAPASKIRKGRGRGLPY